MEESWKRHLVEEFEKPYFVNLVNFVRQEYATTTCYPPGQLIFNAFNLCPYDKVKVVIIDGNRFKPYRQLPYKTIVKGDGKYLSIAAASILAKTYRDDYMDEQALIYPGYDWKSNKGYPTKKHREAIRLQGITPIHRKTFTLLPQGELNLFDNE